MPEQPDHSALYEWNRLARENAENRIVSSMLDATAAFSEPIEIFATWLLVGTAAIAAFFVTNAVTITDALGRRGFAWCGILLCLSCFFGVLSRIYALQSKIFRTSSNTVSEAFNRHAALHAEEEERIRENAEKRGVSVDPGLRIERILNEYLAAFPTLVQWLAWKRIRKNQHSPQAGFIPPISAMLRQAYLAGLQISCFLGFLVAGIGFAVLGSYGLR